MIVETGQGALGVIKGPTGLEYPGSKDWERIYVSRTGLTEHYRVRRKPGQRVLKEWRIDAIERLSYDGQERAVVHYRNRECEGTVSATLVDRGEVQQPLTVVTVDDCPADAGSQWEYAIPGVVRHTDGTLWRYTHDFVVHGYYRPSWLSRVFRSHPAWVRLVEEAMYAGLYLQREGLVLIGDQIAQVRQGVLTDICDIVEGEDGVTLEDIEAWLPDGTACLECSPRRLVFLTENDDQYEFPFQLRIVLRTDKGWFEYQDGLKQLDGHSPYHRSSYQEQLDAMQEACLHKSRQAIDTQEVLEEFVLSNQELLVSIEDSVQAGNCRIGSDDFARKHYPDVSSVALGELWQAHKADHHIRRLVSYLKRLADRTEVRR